MESRSVRITALCLFLGLAGCYLFLSPGSVGGYGYIGEEVESGLRMMSMVTAVSKGLAVPDMLWSRHGPIPVLLDIPFLRIGKEIGNTDLAMSFEPVLLTAALITIVFLWLRKVSSPATSLFLAIAGGFGTMLWPYAYIGLETKQSLFILLTGYLGLACGKIRGWPRVLGFAIVCALALTLKAVGVVLWPAIAYVLYVQFRDDWKERRAQLVATILLIGSVCALNVMLRNFYWNPRGGGEAQFIGWMVKDKFQVFTNIIGLLGSPAKGLFVFAPIMIASLWAIPRAFRENRNIAVFSALILACTLAFLSILVAPYDETWGPRFMHVTIAPLLVCIGAAWPRLRWKVYAPMAVLVGVGVVVSFLGAFFYYGTRGKVSDEVRQNTMEWLTGDNVWNEVAFNARLFYVWWHGSSDPVMWSPAHIWVWTPPADFPGWRSTDLIPHAEAQSYVFFYKNRWRELSQESLWRFYHFSLAFGLAMLLCSVYTSTRFRMPKGFAKVKIVLGLGVAALLAAGVYWFAAPVIFAPRMVLDKEEVVAGRDSYSLRIRAMRGDTVVVRYSIDGAEPAEMTITLDADGYRSFEVGAITPKGVYRMFAFKRVNEERWIDSDAVLVVR